VTDDLSVDDFDTFFGAVHGDRPFPWQRALAERVLTEGWPDAIDIPTGGGKTAALDVALFHLAVEAGLGTERRAPLRILFVVDRRLVVDDSHRRALRLAEALAAPTEEICHRIAQRLLILAESDGPPLRVARLRGGLPKEPDWVRTPAQPTIVVSTVDQVGSRLLFRGYGVSDRMKPVHAGLMGIDSLVLLDEAHLSNPFLQTANDLPKVAIPFDASGRPFRLVSLSATQQRTSAVALTQADHDHEKLGRRLRAAKPAHLLIANAKADEEAFAEVFAEQAWSLSAPGGGEATVVGIVVNRVGRARAVFERLGARLRTDDDRASTDLILLIGRSRDLDRNSLLKEVLPRMKADRKPQGRPLFVVATQCIEAGADVDFDALVTEIAPLDCLRQRFGRLNRSGSWISAPGVILAAKDQIAKNAKPDPLYGFAPLKTWTLLNEVAQTDGKGRTARSVVDMGLSAASAWLPGPSALPPFLAPQQNAPVLLPRDIDLWSITSPLPTADPAVPLYLHGPADDGEVTLVWRADLEGNAQAWIEALTVCPPASLETITLPLRVASRWLRRRASDTSDLPGELEGEDTGDWKLRTEVLRWRGDETRPHFLTSKERLGRGDVLVLASAAGGCDRWGWAPASLAPVPDLGEAANSQQRGIDILRLSPLALQMALEAEGLSEAETAGIVRRYRGFVATLADASDREALREFRDWPDLPIVWHQRLSEAGAEPDPKGTVARSEDSRPLAFRRRLPRKGPGLRPWSNRGEAVTEDDWASLNGEQHAVRLDAHSQGVEAMAQASAAQAGLPPDLAEDVALAAFLHDAGKAHPTFKLFLYGGDELAAVGPPLAKSKGWIGRHAADRAGLPEGARHEIASLAFALAHPRFSQAHDPDLVLWLIGTHHGLGRPFFPAVDWPPAGIPFAVQLDDGGAIQSSPPLALADLTARWLELFPRLKARHGIWRLAHLEAVLRLADHRRSEQEQR